MDAGAAVMESIKSGIYTKQETIDAIFFLLVAEIHLYGCVVFKVNSFCNSSFSPLSGTTLFFGINSVSGQAKQNLPLTE